MKKKTPKKLQRKKKYISKIKDIKVELILSVLGLFISSLSLYIAYKAFNLSDLMFKSSSLTTEPIIDIEITDDKLILENKSNEIYQIVHVNFGLIHPFVIYKNTEDVKKPHVLEISELEAERNLETGHTEGTTTSEKDKIKYNKHLELNLDLGSLSNQEKNNSKIIEELDNEINKMVEMNQVAKSYFFRDYYYIEIYYLDAYGNRNTQYYIYAYEYMNTYQLFKMNKDEYYEYTKYVHDDFNKNANDYLEYLLSDDAIVKDKSSKIYNGDYYQRYNKPWEENIYKELFSE